MALDSRCENFISFVFKSHSPEEKEAGCLEAFLSRCPVRSAARLALSALAHAFESLRQELSFGPRFARMRLAPLRAHSHHLRPTVFARGESAGSRRSRYQK